ncbi:short-chain fatty acid transporter [Salinisphaera sp. Q1T1-3]|uniref:short-chain fatty acid transporter n=1 Tax=Salinisphaera sp. Q1T1-3 TaxID=2321229 RepID=UPI000E70BBB8|nr:TIGR00366 family protein [Salinisphaera sp. Q1T1-3]RJS91093.1 short-chain fatty acid transporter [Salinisphaera sp. Q1T1-3]
MQAITNASVRIISRWLPDAFVLAVILTLAVFALGIGVTHQSPLAMANHWGEGFSSLFKFGMQMTLVLLTGYVLALTPAMQAALNGLTRIPSTPKQALILTILVSFACYYINWGFGMVVGAILAREMGRRVTGLHFPLLVAAAYGGELVRGPSSSIPLVVATPDNFMSDLIGVVPVSATLYAWWNIALTIALVVLLVGLYLVMRPPSSQIVAFRPERETPERPTTARDTPAARLENSRWPTLLLGLIALTYLVGSIAGQGLNINLNTVILIFLTAGLLLHASPTRYLAATEQAVGAARGIIVQFPLYAGIAGMMTHSGLVDAFSAAFVAIATPHTFPLLTFLSAGFVNFFIPSGGGQWAIQGPIMIQAAHEIGADPAQTVMAFAWGDGWTNQIQPFWALPLLGVAGLSARDIMGYCLIWLCVSGTAIVATFVALSVFT